MASPEVKTAKSLNVRLEEASSAILSLASDTLIKLYKEWKDPQDMFDQAFQGSVQRTTGENGTLHITPRMRIRGIAASPVVQLSDWIDEHRRVGHTKETLIASLKPDWDISEQAYINELHGTIASIPQNVLQGVFGPLIQDLKLFQRGQTERTANNGAHRTHVVESPADILHVCIAAKAHHGGTKSIDAQTLIDNLIVAAPESAAAETL